MAEPKRSVADRMGALVMKGLCSLPENVQIALSGKKPIVIDGHTLAPELQLLLAANEKRGQMTLTTPAALRKQQSEAARLISGRPTRVGSVRDLDIDGAAGKLRARHYAPERAEGAPLLVFFHGGGFVFGDLDTHDAPCRVLCRHGGMHVLAVDYRLAPENPFPAPVEDALAALRWAQAHAAELGADPARVGVGGDSAGANLSAAIAQLAVRDGGAPPACQMLVYPAVDRTRPYPSIELFAEGFFLTRASIDWFHRQYSGAPGVHDRDPRLGPLHAESHADLAPALVVTAGFDPLRDEGEAYAAALQAAGTTTVLRRFDALIHGFFNMVGVSPACRDAVIEIAGVTRALFAIGAAQSRRATSSSPRASQPGVSPS
ncbi:MAG: Alpha/beta hydrolase fold-3 domain protein [Labilithrix sp.]|nr:Alpha/beta hydrolase fold-3 domain protein [Labilithrix sp.]